MIQPSMVSLKRLFIHCVQGLQPTQNQSHVKQPLINKGRVSLFDSDIMFIFLNVIFETG